MTTICLIKKAILAYILTILFFNMFSRGVNRSKNPGGPGTKKSGGATYKHEKGGCVIYYIAVKKLGGPWPPRPPQCLRPCDDSITIDFRYIDARCLLYLLVFNFRKFQQG